MGSYLPPSKTKWCIGTTVFLCASPWEIKLSFTFRCRTVLWMETCVSYSTFKCHLPQLQTVAEVLSASCQFFFSYFTQFLYLRISPFFQEPVISINVSALFGWKGLGRPVSPWSLNLIAWTAQKGSVKPCLELDKCLAFWKENNPKQVVHIHSYSAEIQVNPTNLQTFFVRDLHNCLVSSFSSSSCLSPEVLSPLTQHIWIKGKMQ